MGIQIDPAGASQGTYHAVWRDRSRVILQEQLNEIPLQTHRHMRKGLVSAFEAADSYAIAIALSKVISTVKDFSEDEKAVILRACKTNDQVFNAMGVVSRVRLAIGVLEPTKDVEADDVPF